MRNWIFLPFILFLVTTQKARCESDDLDTQIVLNTFKISNPKSSATVFVLSPRNPGAPYLMVTALHVFSKMDGDDATLYLRKKDDKDPDLWVKVPLKIKVRENGKALWTKHADADVAVLPFTPPADVAISGLSIDRLASDDTLKQFEIHPGDPLKCIGYPHPNQFNSGPAWFPVVRLGCIAGYPLTPMLKYRTFLADIDIFEGNSGGPVYFTDSGRIVGGKTHDGRIQFIVGMVSEQHFIDDKYETPYESGQFRHRLNLGVIVNAATIRETIDLLPKSALGTASGAPSVDAKSGK